MGIVFRRITTFLLFLGLCAGISSAQQATVKRAVVLRRDPVKTAPVIEHLAKGDRLVLVQSAPDGGYYHVQTEADQIGWVAASYVSVSTEPPTPTTPTPPVVTPPGGTTGGGPATGCDDTLWAHVYHNTRLIVHQQCIAVTGTMVDSSGGTEPDGVRHEQDGDTHGWLKVDPQFEGLLNNGNKTAEHGNLVFEVICKYQVTQADAVSACKNYTNKVTLPPVGSHVQILGVYVQDTFHAQWMEIHPVTSISVQ